MTAPVAESPPADTLIRASAGTGKTFQLSNRYLGLLGAGAEPEEVLATTFTRKAAAEILDRVLLRLARAAGDPHECARLAEQAAVADLTPERVLALLVALARHLDRLRVMTLDSFFAHVAGRYALELGLPPGWSIADDLTDARLRSEAIEALLESGSDAEVQRLMNLMTKGDAQRSVSQLIRDTVDNLYNVFREADPAAWRRLARPRQLSGEQLAEALAQLESAALPSDKRLLDARERDVQLAQAGDWETFITAGLAAKVLSGESTYYKKPIPAAVLRLYETLLDHVRAVELTRLANQTEATAEMLARFDREYRRLKHQRRLLRFEDVTAAVAAAAPLAASGSLAYRLDADITHLLLDEFQDTSLAQWQAIMPLASRASGGAGRSLFCVGDVKQAIYGWRGGVAEIFEALTEKLPTLKSQELSTSYRSAPPIIDAVNVIFSSRMHEKHGNLDDLEPSVAQWCADFPPHSTARTGLSGYVALETGPSAKDAATNGDVAPGAGDDDQRVVTLKYAAERIAEHARRIGSRTIGVLVRANKTVARLIHELRKLNVDASEEGGNPLTDSAAVGVVLSLLRLADHPGDSAAAFHVAHSPLGPVVGFSAEHDRSAVCDLARRVRRTLQSDGYGLTIRGWTERLAPNCNARELARLRQLTELACDYDSAATLRARDFVELVEQRRVPRAATAQVRIMTVHQAKGLEFDVVVLPDLDVELLGQPPAHVAGRPGAGEPIDRVCLYRKREIRRLLPADVQELYRRGTRDDVAEALSLLYVMLTRPVHALYMIIAPSSAAKSERLHKKFSGLLRASLTDGQKLLPRQTVYEHGNRDWYRDAGDGPPGLPAAGKNGSPAQEPLEVRLAPPRPSGQRGLAVQSPSRRSGHARVGAADVLGTIGAAARRRGTLLHAWFQQIEWLDETFGASLEVGGGVPDDATLRRVATELGMAGPDLAGPDLGDPDLGELIAGFRRSLAAPAIAAALRPSAYRPPQGRGFAPRAIAELAAGPTRLVVRRERPIAARDENRLILGQIDRLVLAFADERPLLADIIDFKTGGFPGADAAALAEHVARYRPQLDEYRRAVALMYRLPPDRVGARLLFLDAGVAADL